MNAEPLILVENYYSEWTGTNHSLEGYIVDEGRTTVEVTMLSMDFSVHIATITTQTEANGFWSIEFPESHPENGLFEFAIDTESETTEK